MDATNLHKRAQRTAFFDTFKSTWMECIDLKSCSRIGALNPFNFFEIEVL
jgi:hypothetical protein